MKPTEIAFKLHNIKTEQFAIIEDVYKEGDTVQLESNYRFGIISADKVVVVIVNYKFKTSQSPFLVIEVGCFFNIKEESWDLIYKTEESELVLPKETAAHLLVLTIGTTRGVLHAKTENSIYNRFFLPALNISDNIKEDIVITE